VDAFISNDKVGGCVFLKVAAIYVKHIAFAH
jgi:hypothetical protein